MAEETLVDRVLNLTKPGEDQHRERSTRYDNAYDIYRASMQRPASLEPWQSKLRVPYGRQVIDTAMVNIVTGKPRVVVRPRRPEFEMGAKAMQAALDYYVAEDHMVEKQPTFAQQGLVYGVTVAKNHWLYSESERTFRSSQPHPFDPSQQISDVQTQRVVDRDGPTFEPWNIYYAFWDPNASDVDNARYVCLDSYVTPDELLKNEVNPETGQGLYQNVSAALKTGQGKSPLNTAQERFLGGRGNRFKGMVHLREIWWKDRGRVRLTVLANLQVVVRDEPSPYWHGKFPVVIAQTHPDMFEMVGIPETEAVDHLQQALWTVQNRRMDNEHLTVMRGVTYREGAIADPNAIQLRPRFKWPVFDHDDIKPFEVQPLPPEAFREEQELLGRLQYITGITPYISGADMAGMDQNTATGVTALQEVASRLLRFKAGQLHNKGYQRSFEQWGDLIQQFLDKDLAVKIIGEGGQEQWFEIPPEAVIGHFQYALEGSEESLSRQQERGEATQLLNVMAPLIQAGLVNPKPLLEKVAAAYNFPNPEALMVQPQQQLPAAPQPMNGQPQQLALTQGGAQLDPRIQQAIGGGR